MKLSKPKILIFTLILSLPIFLLALFQYLTKSNALKNNSVYPNNLKIEASENKALISFTTETPTLSRITYADSKKTFKHTLTSKIIQQQHKFILKNLTPNTDYNLLIEVKDPTSNFKIRLNKIFRTKNKTTTKTNQNNEKTSTENNTQNTIISNNENLFGIMGVNISDFSKIKELKAKTVEVHKFSGIEELKNIIENAQNNNLSVFVRAPERNNFQNLDQKIDEKKVLAYIDQNFMNLPDNYYKNLIGLWLIDEPCHSYKWNISGNDLSNLYNRVKQKYPNLNILINFGSLECLNRLSSETQEKFVDIALFTITQKKASSQNFFQTQAELAQNIKSKHKYLKIVPMLATINYANIPDKFPTPEWILNTGQKLKEQNLYSGLLLFSYRPLAKWMEETLINYVDDPIYKETVIKVLSEN